MKLHNMMAVSLDGKIARDAQECDETRRETGFTNADDHALVLKRLQSTEAVIIGANTLRAAASVWDMKNKDDRYPVWIIFSNKGIENHLPFWNQKHVRRVLVSQRPLDCREWPDKEVENWCYGETEPALFAHNRLSEMKISNALLFGGGSVNAMFYRADLVDSLELTLVPQILGSATASHFVDPTMPDGIGLELQSSLVSKNHVFLTYTVKKHCL